MTDPGGPLSDTRIAAEAELRRIAQAGDGPIELAHAALTLAVYDDPSIQVAPYHRHLDALAADVAREAKGKEDCGARVDALNSVMLARWGYRGDAEGKNEVENADFVRVLDRRRGLPVALGILYIHAARAQGWRMAGLNFPGHFLLRLEQKGARVVFDPSSVRMLDSADLRRLVKIAEGDKAELRPVHYREAADRDILLRLRNNLRLRLVRAGDVQRAAAVTRSMLLIAPERAALWREMGLLYAELGEVGPAISALQRFLDSGAADAARYQAAALLQKLRAQLT